MMLNSAVILLMLFNCIDAAMHMANVLSPLSQKVIANNSHDCWNFVPAGCVDGHNIGTLYKDKSIAECTVLCSENPKCLAIEYGVSYGGDGDYKPRDCQLQDSADSGTCNGKDHNLDLYKKFSCPQEAIIPTCWDFVPGGCVDGQNIILHKDKSIAECKVLCSENSLCLAIEYGVPYGGGGQYESRDCQLKDSADSGTCNGRDHNLDLYKKFSCPQNCWDFDPAGCVDGHNTILHEDKSVVECTALCSENLKCLAIEYGASYGGDGDYKPRDCLLQDLAASGTCNGEHHNLDLYKKFSCPQGQDSY